MFNSPFFIWNVFNGKEKLHVTCTSANRHLMTDEDTGSTLKNIQHFQVSFNSTYAFFRLLLELL